MSIAAGEIAWPWALRALAVEKHADERQREYGARYRPHPAENTSPVHRLTPWPRLCDWLPRVGRLVSLRSMHSRFAKAPTRLVPSANRGVSAVMAVAVLVVGIELFTAATHIRLFAQVGYKNLRAPQPSRPGCRSRPVRVLRAHTGPRGRSADHPEERDLHDRRRTRATRAVGEHRQRHFQVLARSPALHDEHPEGGLGDHLQRVVRIPRCAVHEGARARTRA